ncbi:hypothetical protein KIN20_017181, partial [Parelaphostrongylus tenuis]
QDPHYPVIAIDDDDIEMANNSAMLSHIRLENIAVSVITAAVGVLGLVLNGIAILVVALQSGFVELIWSIVPLTHRRQYGCSTHLPVLDRTDYTV